MYISIKLNERSPLSSSDLSAATRGAYPAGEIEARELEILRVLEWRVCPPTAYQVGLHVASLMLLRVRATAIEAAGRDGAAGVPAEAARIRTWGYFRDEVAFRVELSVRDYVLSIGRPSTVAVAAVLDVIEREDGRARRAYAGALSSVLEFFDFDGPGELVGAKARLGGLVENEEGGGDRGGGNDVVDEEVTSSVVSSSEEEDGAEDVDGGEDRIQDGPSSVEPMTDGESDVDDGSW